MHEPSAFCPAAKAGALVARLEAHIDMVERLRADAVALSPDEGPQSELVQDYDRTMERLFDELDAARTELAGAQARSSAGAIAQLLGIIRDLRIADDPERSRAFDAEVQVLGFLESSGILPPACACHISRTLAFADAGPGGARRGG